MYYFFVETRGYTLEQITTIFDAKGLSWKQRRNLRPVQRVNDSASPKESGESVHKAAAHASAKEVAVGS